MIFFQHIHQLRGNSLRAYYRGTATDTDDFHMRDSSQTADNVFQTIVAYQQCVTTGQQHVSYLRSLGDVLDTSVNTFGRGGTVFLSCKTSAGTVTAVHGTLVRDQEQHSVRITVSQSRYGRIAVFV